MSDFLDRECSVSPCKGDSYDEEIPFPISVGGEKNDEVYSGSEDSSSQGSVKYFINDGSISTSTWSNDDKVRISYCVLHLHRILICSVLVVLFLSRVMWMIRAITILRYLQ